MIRASMSSADPRREPNSLTDLQEASDFVAVTNCVLLMFSFKLSSAKMGSHFSTVASTADRLWSCTVVSSAYSHADLLLLNMSLLEAEQLASDRTHWLDVVDRCMTLI